MYKRQLLVSLDDLPKDETDHSRPDTVWESINAFQVGSTLLLVRKSCIAGCSKSVGDCSQRFPKFFPILFDHLVHIFTYGSLNFSEEVEARRNCVIIGHQGSGWCRRCRVVLLFLARNDFPSRFLVRWLLVSNSPTACGRVAEADQSPSLPRAILLPRALIQLGSVICGQVGTVGIGCSKIEAGQLVWGVRGAAVALQLWVSVRWRGSRSWPMVGPEDELDRLGRLVRHLEHHQPVEAHPLGCRHTFPSSPSSQGILRQVEGHRAVQHQLHCLVLSFPSPRFAQLWNCWQNWPAQGRCSVKLSQWLLRAGRELRSTGAHSSHRRPMLRVAAHRRHRPPRIGHCGHCTLRFFGLFLNQSAGLAGHQIIRRSWCK